MRVWAFLLGGLLVWSVHFFALYGIASILLTTPAARALAGLVTLMCLAAIGLLLVRSWRRHQAAQDEVSGWTALLALLINAISAVAVFWQGFPAIFSGA